MNVPVLEQSIEIAAPPAEVWALVSDLRRMAEWSPQVDSTRLSTGHDTSGLDATGLGARVTNRNVQGELAWITHAEVVRFDPDREIAFRVEENWSIWSFSLAPTAAGTRLTQRREAPDGLSASSLRAQDTWLGGQAAFTETLRAGMSETLERIRAALEGPTT